jgi:hypothetical protein
VYEPQVNPSLGERPYSDLGVVKELRAMSNAAKKQAKVAPRVAGEAGPGRERRMDQSAPPCFILPCQAAADPRSVPGPTRADEEKKWLDWPEYLRVCAELRLECAGRDQQGRRRAPEAVAWSLQRFLLFSILSSVPDRQARR